MKTLLSIIAALTAFFLPVQGILIAVSVAIGLDTLTGIYKSYKLKKQIRSRPGSDIFGKLIIYELAVILIFIIDHFLMREFMAIWFTVDYFFTKAVSLVVVGIELTSMKENIEEAHGINIFKWLRSFFERSKEIKNDINDLIP